MTAAPAAEPAEPAASVAASAERRRRDVAAWIAGGWLMLLAVAALAADLLPLADPTDTRAGPPRSGVGWHHWLGTDQLGRDLLSRVIYGSRVSLAVGVAAILMSLSVGVVAGIIAGYVRRLPGAAVLLVADVLLSFPAMLLALAIVTFTDSRGPITVALAIGLIYLGPTIRIARARTLPLAQQEFVVAARLLGAKHPRIVVREILPNVLPAAIALGVVAVGGAIVAEGGLAYLNLSVAPPTPTWGAMMAAGVPNLDDSLLPVLAPAAAMFLTVLSLMILGDHLQPRVGSGASGGR